MNSARASSGAKGPGPRVVAVGSPHGDDQVAWRFAEQLRSRNLTDVTVVALGDPLKIVDHLAECDHLVIVDACSGGGKPGSVTRLEWPDQQIRLRHSHSSHGFGLAHALQLAEKLNGLPRKVVLFGVEIATVLPSDSPSETVASALKELERKVLFEIQSAQRMQY